MITTTFSAFEIYTATKNIKGRKIFLIDVDHTLIWPTSLTLRTVQHHKMIDEIKKSILDVTRYGQVIGQWRLQRSISLTDSNWPKILEEIKKESEIYGLTKVETGSFGPIPSMEQWRIDELSNLDIRFSHNEKIEYMHPQNGPSCHKGCIITGKKTKTQALEYFFSYFLHPPESIVIVDDKIEHIESVHNFCMEKNMNFFGFHWKIPLIQSTPKIDALAKKQQRSLVKDYAWIEY